MHSQMGIRVKCEFEGCQYVSLETLKDRDKAVRNHMLKCNRNPKIIAELAAALAAATLADGTSTNTTINTSSNTSTVNITTNNFTTEADSELPRDDCFFKNEATIGLLQLLPRGVITELLEDSDGFLTDFLPALMWFNKDLPHNNIFSVTSDGRLRIRNPETGRTNIAPPIGKLLAASLNHCLVFIQHAYEQGALESPAFCELAWREYRVAIETKAAMKPADKWPGARYVKRIVKGKQVIDPVAMTKDLGATLMEAAWQAAHVGGYPSTREMVHAWGLYGGLGSLRDEPRALAFIDDAVKQHCNTQCFQSSCGTTFC